MIHNLAGFTGRTSIRQDRIVPAPLTDSVAAYEAV